MKKRLLMMMLVVMLLLVGCGNADNKDTEVESTTEMNTEVENEAPTQTEMESEAPQPSEPDAPTYTYTDLNKTMYAKSSVNVRSLPSTDGEKLGGLSKAQEVHVTGQCNETSWYRIDYNGSVAYVSNSYLESDKPVEETPTPEEPTQPSVPVVESFQYALNSPWYDASTNSVYYYLIGTNWDENGTYTTYMTACDLYDQNSSVGDVHTVEGPYFVGKYIEGDIYKIRVYKFIVN